jgi:crotonobetainyl-CoA:carnitine CoA-transferase CaiB-like acyl-CoA transferase
VPINLHGTPGAIQGPQPLPGQHNREILGALGYSDAELATITGGAV